MPLNERLLRIAVSRQAEPVLVKQVRPYVKLAFEDKKKQFLQAFDEHPVSREISAGPKAFSQISELAAAGGNLFSLLGFYAEQRPVIELREYLTSNVVLYKTRGGQIKNDRIIFATDVLAPAEDEINAWMAANPNSALEWTSYSWTQLLADGISGLPRYLFDLTRDFSRIPSRSGPAIEAKNDLRGNELGPVPYINDILDALDRIISPRK